MSAPILYILNVLIAFAWLLPFSALLPLFIRKGAHRSLWLVLLEVLAVGAFLLLMLATFVYPCLTFSGISSNTGPDLTYRTQGCIGISGFLDAVAVPLQYLLLVLVLVAAVFEGVRARRNGKRWYAAWWSPPGIIILEVLAFVLLFFGAAFFA